MSSVVPEVIESTGASPEGLEYEFPRRDLGRGRLVLWFLIAILLAIAYWMIADPIGRVVRNGATFGNVVLLVVWSFLAFQIWRFPLWYCLGLLFGHREIGLRIDWLYAGERVGWLRRSKRWPLQRIKRVQVVELLPGSTPANELRAVMSSAPDTLGTGLARHLQVLTGVLDDGKRIVLAPFYQRELLDRFAVELKQQIAFAAREDEAPAEPVFESDAEMRRPPAPSSETTSPIEAAPAIGIPELIAEAQETMRKAREPDVFDQPPDSDVQMEPFPDGITFRVPPAGVWKGSAGTFQFGILWTVGIAGFTALFVGVGIAQGDDASAGLGALGIMSIFWLAGAGLLLCRWVMGTRESVIAVVSDSVMVMQTGLRRSKRREWPRSEVKTARVGPSGTEINDRPIPELQLYGAKQKLFGMLAGRDERELTWMATLLRRCSKAQIPPARRSLRPTRPKSLQPTASRLPRQIH